jgi:chromatin segregation and condensation protein Rec8/ScpA/Scc1 (kleisin family)
MQTTGQAHNRQARFFAISEAIAEWELRLPPFAGYADGWAGSVSQFLLYVRDGTFPLEYVPLASVIDQYITHIKHLDLDQAGEFLDITASLIQYKSQLILPCDPLLTGTEGPRQKIMNEIGAGEQRRHERKAAQTNTLENSSPLESRTELSLLDLFVLLNEVEQALPADPSYQVSYPPVTVADQLQWLAEWFTQYGNTENSADSLFRFHASDQAKLCLFLALLEMAKSGQLCLEQEAAFGIVAVYPSRHKQPTT